MQRHGTARVMGWVEVRETYLCIPQIGNNIVSGLAPVDEVVSVLSVGA